MACHIVTSAQWMTAVNFKGHLRCDLPSQKVAHSLLMSFKWQATTSSSYWLSTWPVPPVEITLFTCVHVVMFCWIAELSPCPYETSRTHFHLLWRRHWVVSLFFACGCPSAAAGDPVRPRQVCVKGALLFHCRASLASVWQSGLSFTPAVAMATLVAVGWLNSHAAPSSSGINELSSTPPENHSPSTFVCVWDNMLWAGMQCWHKYHFDEWMNESSKFTSIVSTMLYCPV